MVVADSGEFVGSVSAGCVEAGVIAKSAEVIESGQPALLELGIEDAFDSAICLIEWPEKMAGNEPQDWLEMRLNPGAGENARRAAFRPHGARARRLLKRLAARDD